MEMNDMTAQNWCPRWSPSLPIVLSRPTKANVVQTRRSVYGKGWQTHVTRPRVHSLTSGKCLRDGRGMQWNLHGCVLVRGEGEYGVSDTHVSSLIARKKAAERIRDKGRDPKLRSADLLLLVTMWNCTKQTQ